MKTIRVAIVDDSKFVREALQRLLNGDERVALVGAAASGEELLANMDSWRPDVITLDLAMPGLGGLATLDRIMATRPVPVIILSTHSGEGAPLTIDALSRGAVDFIDKESYSLMDFQALRTVLLGKICGVKRATPSTGQTGTRRPRREAADRPRRGKLRRSDGGQKRYEIVSIGASTGGPQAIERIVGDLRSHLSVPVVIVQHMPKGFTSAFAERLARCLQMCVVEAADDAALLPGCVYVAPADRHLRVARHGDALAAALSLSPTRVAHRPSVDVLFSSVAASVGNAAVGVLLTGMGQDGARGMAEMAQAGAYTIAQDGDSCVVNGMPQAAVALGAARAVISLHEIGRHVLTLLAHQSQEAQLGEEK